MPRFEQLLGDGSEIGMSFDYLEQPSPDGLAQAFILGRDFIGNDNVSLILGDNIFHGNGFNEMLVNSVAAVKQSKNAIVFLYGQSYVDAAFILSIHIWTGVFVFLGVLSSKYLIIENLYKKAFYVRPYEKRV